MLKRPRVFKFGYCWLARVPTKYGYWDTPFYSWLEAVEFCVVAPNSNPLLYDRPSEEDDIERDLKTIKEGGVT